MLRATILARRSRPEVCEEHRIETLEESEDRRASVPDNVKEAGLTPKDRLETDEREEEENSRYEILCITPSTEIPPPKDDERLASGKKSPKLEGPLRTKRSKLEFLLVSKTYDSDPERRKRELSPGESNEERKDPESKLNPEPKERRWTVELLSISTELEEAKTSSDPSPLTSDNKDSTKK